MKKNFTILIVAIMMAITNGAIAQTCNAPVVTSFSPNTGLIGSTVTISGSYFDPIAANNHVMFGATKATVVTASFGTLTVTVPAGANTAPISVRNACNLIGYSSTAFNGIFCPTPINATTYQNTSFTLTGVYGAYNMVAMDMDLDGKPEVISAANGGGLTIARNLSTPGNLNFVAHNFGGAGGNSVVVADFDGDGKVDIFTPNRIARNISTGPGNINFQFLGSVGGYQVATGDFNNDGKIDILYQDGSHNLYLRRNTSTGPGVISFAHAFVVNVGFRNNGVQVADVDGDGKVDIMASQGDGNRMVSLRNTTAVNATNFTFEPLEAWPSNGQYPYRAMIADFDKDGKIDFTTPNYNGVCNTAIYRNTSVVGNISFAPTVNLPAPSGNYRIGVGDVNGDGFPDIVTKSLAQNVFSVYPNTSTGPGNTSFSARIDYSSSDRAEVSGIVIGDLDGDFVPDIATSGISSNTIRFHRNTSAQADVTPPTAISKNIIVALSPSGTVTVTPEMVDNGSGDACGIASMTLNDAASVTFTCSEIGINTVTLKVTDKGGNVSTVTATVTVAPAAIIIAGQSTVCQGQTVAMNANVGDSYQWYKDGIAIAGATAQTYSATESGDYTVAVTNAGGCSGTSSATAVTVNNNPTVTISPGGSATLCGGSLTLTASQSSTYQWYLNGVAINGATQRTYNATAGGSYTVSVLDLFGCSATSAAVAVNATDNIAPVAKVKNLTVGLDANLSASVSVADINDGSSDNCSNITFTLSGKTTFSCTEVGQVVPVTLIVTDASSNVSSAVAMVTVTDPNSYCNAAPVAIAKPLTLSANANCQASASAADFNNGSSDADGDPMTFTVSPAGPYAKGVTNVVLTVSDNRGGSSTASTTVTVNDVTAPTIAGPHNQIIDLNNTCSVALPDYRTQLLALGDNCTPNNALIVTQSPAPGTMISGTGNMTVSFTAQDAAGNVGNASFTVTKRDAIAPVVATKNYTVQLDANGQGTVTTADVNNNSSDNCSPVALTFSNTGTVCGIANEGSVLTLTAPAGAVFTSINFASYGTAAGNCGSFTQSWCHATNSSSIVANALIGKNSGSISATNGVFGDPCGGTYKRLVVQATYSIQGISANGNSITFNCSQKGNNTVTLIGTDASGNVSSKTAVVTVVDNIAPTVATKNITVQLNASGNASITASSVNNGSSDNCGITNLTVSKTSFNCSNVGPNTVTLTATDASGNTSTNTAVVTVEDKVAPVVVTRNITVQLNAAGNASITTAQVNNGSSDACGIASYSLDINSFNCSNVGNNTVTLTVTDVNGNTSAKTAIVMVQDNIAPVVATQNMLIQLDANGTASITPAQINNGSADACGIATLALDKTSFDCSNVGDNTVTLTVMDVNGNVSTGTATVIVEDKVAPVVSAQNVSVTLANGAASITAAQVNNGSADACGIASMTVAPNSFTCDDLGSNTVTLTVTDNNGNVSSKKATVTVVGATPAPAIAVTRSGSNINTGAGVNTIFLGYGNQAVTLTASNSTSAAGATSYSWSPAAGLSNANSADPVFTPTAGGSYTFTVTATNEFGCTATTSVTIDVVDARCGNKMNKVLVCHNGHEICISANAVPAHLAHGCSVGACGSATARGAQLTETAKLEAYPNPFSDRTNLEFSVTQNSKFRLEVLDVKGSLVKVMAEGNAKAGKLQAYEFIAGNLSEGVYIIRLTTDTEVKHVKMVLKH